MNHNSTIWSILLSKKKKKTIWSFQKHFSNFLYYLFGSKFTFSAFFFFFFFFPRVFFFLRQLSQFTYCNSTVYDTHNHFIPKKIFKMDLTILFTHLKIILLQYFQFSISTKISYIQINPKCSKYYKWDFIRLVTSPKVKFPCNYLPNA